MLLDGPTREVTLAAEGPVSWCIGNADARGFFRTSYDGPTLGRLLPAVASLRPPERMGLVSDQWALVRAAVVPVSAFLELVASLRDDQDHVVLDDLVGRLATLEHRHLADSDRPRFQAFVRELVAARAARLGWGPAPGVTEDDETRLRRAALLRALVLLARATRRPSARPSGACRRRRRERPPRRKRSTPTSSTSSSRRRRAAPTTPVSRSCAGARAKRPTRRPSGATCTPSRASRARGSPRAPSSLGSGPMCPCRTSRRTWACCSGTRRRARRRGRLSRRASPRCAPRRPHPCCSGASSESLAALPERRHPRRGHGLSRPSHPIDGAKPGHGADARTTAHGRRPAGAPRARHSRLVARARVRLSRPPELTGPRPRPSARATGGPRTHELHHAETPASQSLLGFP